MCGFCGIFKENGKVEERKITAMRETMFHRGPDEGANYIDGKVGIGFRRLNIIDLQTGSQPISSEDGYLWLVCNGEIYNYRDLQKMLRERGHILRTKSDVEVILHLYEDEGVKCLDYLRGMFSFVVWDKKKQTLFGARDRFGIKPFYYTNLGNDLAFASEIKAFTKMPDFKAEPAREAFMDYLTFQYVPEPRTMFKDVYRLPPGHFFIKTDAGSTKIEKYWQPEFIPEEGNSFEYYTEGLMEKMRESVKLHLNSDVPRGCFLSGGIDSSIITALAREREKVSTFSVGYAEGKYSELEEARRTAEFLETEHNEYIIEPEDFVKHLPRLIWHFDEPVADPAAISLYFVAKMASKDITVTLSGEGADEVFGGYGIYREPYSLEPLRKVPEPLKKLLFAAASLMPGSMPGKNYLHRAEKNLEERFIGNAKIFSEDDKANYTKIKQKYDPFRITNPLYDKVSHLDDVTKMQYIDINTWLAGDILVKADKMTMANSLELRVPFLDHVLFEFAAKIPAKYKIAGKTTKKVLREAFKDILPENTINRPKKGFPVPTREWLKREDFQQLFFELLAGNNGGFFDKDQVKTMYNQHLNKKVDFSRKLWVILVYLLWYENYIKS